MQRPWAETADGFPSLWLCVEGLAGAQKCKWGDWVEGDCTSAGLMMVGL